MPKNKTIYHQDHDDENSVYMYYNDKWNIKLFVNADKYCKIDIWPNLKFKFETPNIIFSSLSRFIYGKWYKPASGLYILLFVTSKKIIKAEEEQNIIKFLVK